jgi:hypothetical protein
VGRQTQKYKEEGEETNKVFGGYEMSDFKQFAE